VALTVRALKSLTAPLAGDLAARGVADAVLSGIRPGGTENPARNAQGWLRYYGRLCALRALSDRDTPAEGSAAAADADRIILEALAGIAKPVTLSGSQGLELQAHPKSAFALLQCHVRNLAIARLLTYAEQLGRSQDADAHDLIARALAEATHQHRVLAWIACTPGPGLPFPEYERDPELKAPFTDLAPHDLIAICRAFDEVNWARLRALEALVSPDPEDDGPRKRPSWSQFFASATASEGGASEHVLRDRSLAGFLATTQLASSAQREAMADAKAKSQRDGER
jgi:hypothetical protein